MQPNEGKPNFVYTSGNPAGTPNSPPPSSPEEPSSNSNDIIQWNASEFIDHQKNAGWLVLLCVAGVVICGAVYLVTKDILATIVVGIGGLAFGIFAYKKPRTLTYSLTPSSVKVGDKSYSYDDFRTFSLIQDGALPSILLEPLRRFVPPLTIYFAPEDGDKILTILTNRIPHQDRTVDIVDRFMRRIRF